MKHTPPPTASWPAALRDARRRAGISQRELAAGTGLPQGHISRIEGGAVDPRLSSAVKIARTLGFEPMLIPRRALPAVLDLLRGFEPSGVERPLSLVELLVGDGDGDGDGQ